MVMRLNIRVIGAWIWLLLESIPLVMHNLMKLVFLFLVKLLLLTLQHYFSQVTAMAHLLLSLLDQSLPLLTILCLPHILCPLVQLLWTRQIMGRLFQRMQQAAPYAKMSLIPSCFSRYSFCSVPIPICWFIYGTNSSSYDYTRQSWYY